jgi:uncharacterized membrane protein YczE
MFVIGLFVMTFGIALSTKADIGTTPISSIPFVLSLTTGVELYLTTFALNIGLIVLQYLVLRKDFSYVSLLQLPVSIVFSFFTKITVDLVSGWSPQSYVECWIYAVLSVVILGAGVALVVNSRTTMVPGEGAVLALSIKTKVPFSRMKIIFDVTNISIAAVISLISFGGLQGVREGTIFAALTVGIVVRYTTRVIKRLFPDPENKIS